MTAQTVEPICATCGGVDREDRRTVHPRLNTPMACDSPWHDGDDAAGFVPRAAATLAEVKQRRRIRRPAK